MLVAVISDTHMAGGGRRRLPDRCLELIRAADLLVHAGDIMSVEALIEFADHHFDPVPVDGKGVGDGGFLGLLRGLSFHAFHDFGGG